MLEGVDSYDISLEKQEVIVKGSIGYDDLLEKIKKTGKEVRDVSFIPKLLLKGPTQTGPLWLNYRVNVDYRQLFARCTIGNAWIN